MFSLSTRSIPKPQAEKVVVSRTRKACKNSKATAGTPVESDSAECPHCVGGEETYGYLKRSWVYDVDLAREIVSDGRDPVEMESDDVAYCVDNNRIYEQHLDHVNPVYPGILAHLWGRMPSGTIEHGHVLIDGNHRAARCLRDQLPFRAYLLTEDESESILVRGMRRDGQLTGAAPVAGE